jgi:hypothetical protein
LATKGSGPHKPVGGKKKSHLPALLITTGAAAIKYVADNDELRNKISDASKTTYDKTLGTLRSRKDINRVIECFKKGDQGARESLIEEGSKAVKPLMHAWDSFSDYQKIEAAEILGMTRSRLALKLLKKDLEEKSLAVRAAMKKAREQILRESCD